jgi:hypothetical protein
MEQDDADELLAGMFVSVGRYVRTDDGANRVIVVMEEPGYLPPSFDGHVAVYRSLPGGPPPQLNRGRNPSSCRKPPNNSCVVVGHGRHSSPFCPRTWPVDCTTML